MYGKFKEHLENEIESIRQSGLFKNERIIASSQGPVIRLNSGQEVLNFCANNYLGLSSHPEIIKAAKSGLDSHGFGMSSVRFICGTQDIHKELEKRISDFFSTDDTILYAACFDANGGVFEPLFAEDDAIISDALNHASIIDGVRLCKASRYRYRNADMEDLEDQLRITRENRFKIIVTDAVFSMDGNITPLDRIIDLAEKYDALVMVDECHSAGVIGKTGRGITEYFNRLGKVDIITGTLGKAFGGGIGGFATGRREIIDFLRQRSRPYLFSNSLPPAIVNAAIAAFGLLSKSNELVQKLSFNTVYFSDAIKKAGFKTKPSLSSIIAIMLYDARLSQEFAARLLEEGVYVTGFFFPVVPKNEARIRIQVSAAHEISHLDKAIEALIKVGKDFKIIS